MCMCVYVCTYKCIYITSWTRDASGTIWKCVKYVSVFVYICTWSSWTRDASGTIWKCVWMYARMCITSWTTEDSGMCVCVCVCTYIRIFICMCAYKWSDHFQHLARNWEQVELETSSECHVCTHVCAYDTHLYTYNKQCTISKPGVHTTGMIMNAQASCTSGDIDFSVLTDTLLSLWWQRSFSCCVTYARAHTRTQMHTHTRADTYTYTCKIMYSWTSSAHGAK